MSVREAKRIPVELGFLPRCRDLRCGVQERDSPKSAELKLKRGAGEVPKRRRGPTLFIDWNLSKAKAGAAERMAPPEAETYRPPPLATRFRHQPFIDY